TLCLTSSCNPGCTSRATISVLPPGGAGEMILMIRLGYCAGAAVAETASASAANAATPVLRQVIALLSRWLARRRPHRTDSVARAGRGSRGGKAPRSRPPALPGRFRCCQPERGLIILPAGFVAEPRGGPALPFPAIGSRGDERFCDTVRRPRPPAPMACGGSGSVCRHEFRCPGHGVLPEPPQSPRERRHGRSDSGAFQQARLRPVGARGPGRGAFHRFRRIGGSRNQRPFHAL